MFVPLVIPMRQECAEALDQPSAMLTDLAENLRDIRRLNRYLGETRIVLSYLDQLLPPRAATLLDVATGSADIPLAAVARARSRGQSLLATGLDSSEEILREADRHCQGRVELVLGDARSLPFNAHSYDVVTSSLALHHFNPEEARAVLAEMWRVARRGILVVDLARSYPAYWGTWIATRVIARNRVTRRDGPLSVLRAYTPGELLELARAAGIGEPRVSVHPLFRQILIAGKDIPNG